MNKEQRNYFVKRVEQLRNAKISDIRTEMNRDIEAAPSIVANTLLEAKQHKEEFMKKLYEMVVAALEANNSHINFYVGNNPWGKNDSNDSFVLPFSEKCLKWYNKVVNNIKDDANKRIAKINEEARRLTDKAMFCELPDEFVELLESFERFE